MRELQMQRVGDTVHVKNTASQRPTQRMQTPTTTAKHWVVLVMAQAMQTPSMRSVATLCVVYACRWVMRGHSQALA
jgi:K+-sensing histidine kinase KdpD